MYLNNVGLCTRYCHDNTCKWITCGTSCISSLVLYVMHMNFEVKMLPFHKKLLMENKIAYKYIYTCTFMLSKFLHVHVQCTCIVYRRTLGNLNFDSLLIFFERNSFIQSKYDHTNGKYVSNDNEHQHKITNITS